MEFVQDLLSKNAPNSEEVLKYIKFKDNLCHECNKKVPTYLYCHPMYGGKFKQNYGWYINKQFYEFGILSIYDTLHLPEFISQDLLVMLIELNIAISHRERISDTDSTDLYEIRRKIGKLERKINNYVENVVREKFGYRKIGESWVSETILYNIVRTLFPNYTVRKHYRPEWLEGLELDIYIEELNLGIEYQGEQHFKPIKHWGGESALQKVKERDQRKRNLCESIGIKLIYFYYDEDLTEEYVRNKLENKLDRKM